MCKYNNINIKSADLYDKFKDVFDLQDDDNPNFKISIKEILQSSFGGLITDNYIENSFWVRFKLYYNLINKKVQKDLENKEDVNIIELITNNKYIKIEKKYINFSLRYLYKPNINQNTTIGNWCCEY